MKEEHALLAGEMSGNPLLRGSLLRLRRCDLRLASLARNSGARSPFDFRICRDVPTTFATPQIRVDCPDAIKFEVVRAVTTHFKNAGVEVVENPRRSHAIRNVGAPAWVLFELRTQVPSWCCASKRSCRMSAIAFAPRWKRSSHPNAGRLSRVRGRAFREHRSQPCRGLLLPSPTSGPSLRPLIGCDDFRTRGIEKPRLDAEVLLAHALSSTRVQLVVDSMRPLAPEELAISRCLVIPPSRKMHGPWSRTCSASVNFHGALVQSRSPCPRAET